MFGTFHPREEYIGPSILTLGSLYFIFLLVGMLKLSLEFISSPPFSSLLPPLPPPPPPPPLSYVCTFFY
jgi:hypothetical protein